MAVVKRIVCLANSRKKRGFCVAGRELLATGVGPWLRPVSDRESEEVSPQEQAYQNGKSPQLLDVIDIPLIEPRPKGHQTENWLLDPQKRWQYAGKMRWEDLNGLAENPVELWVNGQSTNAGLNDRMRPEDAANLRGSLYLLHLDNLDLRVFVYFRRRIHAIFTHHGISYSIAVTDPAFESKYYAGENGIFPLGECFVTISLGEPYEGYCYKLVAGIFPK